MKTAYCLQCHTKNSYESHGFRSTCEKCSHDLHICKNCSFYDENTYNECKEPSAERVADKEKNNLCEYFKPLETTHKNTEKKEDLLKQAEALFKK